MNFDKYEKRGAYHFDWYKTEEWYREIIDFVVSKVSGNVVDLGCGDGLLAKKLAEKGCSVMGIDNDLSGLRYLRGLVPEADFSHEDIDKMFRIPPADWVTCINTIEHLQDPERLPKLIADSGIKRGIIITDVPQATLGRHHTREFTNKELRGLFAPFFTVVPIKLKTKQFHGIEING